MLAIFVAVFLAAAGCVATVVTLGNVPAPSIQVVVGEEETEPEGGPGSAPSPEPESPEPESPGPETAAPEAPQEGGGTEPVPAGSYDGAVVRTGAFEVVVETAYTDPTITDGMGMHDTAPPGQEYFILRLDVTNISSAPAAFDPVGSVGLATDGQEYMNDPEAEYTVAYDYFWEDILPGETVTTHILFLVPVGTEFSAVLINGQERLGPN
ncbi:DUF4352 domain-containing protein [Nocardiopsis sp. NPDC058631]|uniref:DUF4352 domain-containing protein n=1 Tax=Nocardiopsis sp. NPDC058631 TaxID=3346566 RepID=UPI0036507B7B